MAFLFFIIVSCSCFNFFLYSHFSLFHDFFFSLLHCCFFSHNTTHYHFSFLRYHFPKYCAYPHISYKPRCSNVSLLNLCFRLCFFRSFLFFTSFCFCFLFLFTTHFLSLHFPVICICIFPIRLLCFSFFSFYFFALSLFYF